MIEVEKRLKELEARKAKPVKGKNLCPRTRAGDLQTFRNAKISLPRPLRRAHGSQERGPPIFVYLVLLFRILSKEVNIEPHFSTHMHQLSVYLYFTFVWFSKSFFNIQIHFYRGLPFCQSIFSFFFKRLPVVFSSCHHDIPGYVMINEIQVYRQHRGRTRVAYCFFHYAQG